MGRRKKTDNTAQIGFGQQIWSAADLGGTEVGAGCAGAFSGPSFCDYRLIIS
ncbi:MAG: hypothetical protein IKG18_06605 [Atopobiaceae bacterium]|nr:hypothetical protein [Atopobiaceae bacterium]